MNDALALPGALAAPAAFAERRLFEPIAPRLARFTAPGVPSRAALDALLAEAAPTARSGGGARIRFAAPGEDEAGYEAHIFATGEVPTREGDWHDFFNALAWCAWPRTKACCNRLHLDELRARAAAAACVGRDGGEQGVELGVARHAGGGEAAEPGGDRLEQGAFGKGG